MVEGAVRRFTVCLEVNGAQVVLAVRGDLDLLTAPELGAVLDAVVDRGHHDVVLDLAECAFIDASGLRGILAGVERFRLWGCELTIRSPSSAVGRFLGLIGLDETLGAPSQSFGRRERPDGHLRPVSLKTSLSARTVDEVTVDALRLAVALLTNAGVDTDEEQVARRLGEALESRRFSARTSLPLPPRASEIAASTGPAAAEVALRSDAYYG
jgi:anti-sigma B factor antagonist